MFYDGKPATISFAARRLAKCHISSYVEDGDPSSMMLASLEKFGISIWIFDSLSFLRLSLSSYFLETREQRDGGHDISIQS